MQCPDDMYPKLYTECPRGKVPDFGRMFLNPLNAKLIPICHFLALLGAHPILHVSRIRVKIKYTDITQTPISEVERLRR